jgi:hypothetical protein
MFIKNNTFWEELITYFPFTVRLVSDTSRKKTLAGMHNEVNKTIQFGGFNVGITDGSDL